MFLYNVGCPTPMHYKNIVLTPVFLSGLVPECCISAWYAYTCEGESVAPSDRQCPLNLAEAVNMGAGTPSPLPLICTLFSTFFAPRVSYRMIEESCFSACGGMHKVRNGVDSHL